MDRPRYVIGICLLLAAGIAAAQGREAPRVTAIEPPSDVLFVGNSFSYYNNGLQNHVGRLTRSAGRDTGRLRLSTLSGGHLYEQAGLPALAELRDWDVIVLQGHSLEAQQDDKVDAFRAAAREHDETIRNSGATTVLFMTWAYAGKPEQTAIISGNYTAAGNELGALVVPVGEAFAIATEQFPDIPLRMADARHPTLEGTYLAACTFFAAFYNASPVGLAYDAGLPPDVAASLQAAAWDAVQAYYRD